MLSPKQFEQLMARASGLELGGEPSDDRHIVKLKFKSRDDAIAAYDALSELDCEEAWEDDE